MYTHHCSAIITTFDRETSYNLLFYRQTTPVTYLYHKAGPQKQNHQYGPQQSFWPEGQ